MLQVGNSDTDNYLRDLIYCIKVIIDLRNLEAQGLQSEMFCCNSRVEDQIFNNRSLWLNYHPSELRNIDFERRS